MKNVKRYLLLCMMFGVMLSFAGCGNKNAGNNESIAETSSNHEERSNTKNDVINESTNNTRNEDVSHKNNGVTEKASDRNNNNGNIVDDIESGVKDIGDDVSKAIDGNR